MEKFAERYSELQHAIYLLEVSIQEYLIKYSLKEDLKPIHEDIYDTLEEYDILAEQQQHDIDYSLNPQTRELSLDPLKRAREVRTLVHSKTFQTQLMEYYVLKDVCLKLTKT